MVHTVEIIAYTPRTQAAGRLTFTLNGNTYHARCYAEPKLADGLLVEGTSYPVSLTVETEGKIDYAAATAPKFEVLKKSDSGDTVRVTGRTWEPVDHQVIKLDAAPTVSVRLNLPQTATDYRGGSWLTAVGILCADLPPEDHD